MTYPTSQEKSWWQKNWLWAVGGGCLVSLLFLMCFGGFFAMIFSTATGTFKSSEVYQQAMQMATTNPQVVQALGEPIEPGFMPSGSINISGPSGNADLAIPISGPQGSGTIYLVATKEAGRWNFSLLEVEIKEQSERINLLR